MKVIDLTGSYLPAFGSREKCFKNERSNPMDFIDSPAWKLLGILLALLMVVTMAYCVVDVQREANESEDAND